MTDVKETVGVSSIRAHFQARAGLPVKELKQAGAFVRQLQTQAEQGAPVAETMVAKGFEQLQRIADRTEHFLFQAAILAGQEGLEGEALDTRVNIVAKGAERVQQTTDRLRDTLQRIGA